MSSNGITAKEACEIAKNSDYDSVKETLAMINRRIEDVSESKRTSYSTIISKQGIDLSGLKFIISDLEGRGFKVKHAVDNSTYSLEIVFC